MGNLGGSKSVRIIACRYDRLSTSLDLPADLSDLYRSCSAGVVIGGSQSSPVNAGGGQLLRNIPAKYRGRP
jgi:hypothetical protein